MTVDRPRPLGVACFVAMFAATAAAFVACSDDESSGASGTADGGGGDVVQPPIPPPPIPVDAPPPPPDLISRTGVLGNATLVADVGEPTDGPAWRDADGALYFTVPGSASPLRRVVPGSAPVAVAIDAGMFAPIGIANGGGDRLYVTEREAVVTVDVDDAGAVAAVARTSGPGGTSFGDVAYVEWDSGKAAFFGDGRRLFRFLAPSDIAIVFDGADSGVNARGIAARKSLAGQPEVFVGGAHVSGGSVVQSYEQVPGAGFVLQDAVNLAGIPVNAIAIDELGRIYVAWAKGIDVIDPTDKTSRAADGEAMLPISAAATSLAFGGADKKTLFITTATGKIYSSTTITKGVLR